MLYNNEIIHEIKYGAFLMSVNTENFEENVLIDCDEYFADFSGYTRAEIKKRQVKFKDLLIDEDFYTICDFTKSNMSEIGEIYLEHRMKCKDGKIVLITNCTKIISHDDPRLIMKVVVTQALDISNPDLPESYNFFDMNIILENMPCGIAIYQLEQEPEEKLRLIFANNKFYSQLGYTKEKYLEVTNGGYVGSLLVNQEDKKTIHNKVFGRDRNDKHIIIEVKMKKADGSIAIMSISGRVFNSGDGILRVQVVFYDISKIVEDEEIIKYQNERYKIIEENTNELLFDYDIKTDVLSLPRKKRFEKLNYKFENYIKNERSKYTVHPEDYVRFRTIWKEAIIKPVKNYVDIRTRAFDDDYCWYRVHYVSVADSSGKIAHVYGRYMNIDDERKMHMDTADAVAKIEKLTISDNITGLLNRHAFKLQAQEIIDGYEPERECLAVVYSDINNFSFVNDNYGYDAGDSMLNDFTSIINNIECVEKGCRINSDFFAYLVKGSNKNEVNQTVEIIAYKFYHMQKQKYRSGNFTVASGIYYISEKCEDISYAIDNADLARKNIKLHNDVNTCVYSEDFRARRTREKSIVTKLQNAINENQIELFLQPKFSMNTRQVIGAEALSRWRNPDGTYKMPYEFIDVLENAGYIVDLDFYIYEQALKCIKRWQNDGKKIVPISVNFSRKNNINPEFTKKVLDLAKQYDIDNKYIEFEITESAFAENTIAMLKNMDILREHGFKVDIDDFGIGYSSLSFLLNSPIDIVKVDKVFVDGIEKSKYHQEFIKQMCMLINTTDKEIIFEGVETEYQADFLCKCGFDLAQGWLFDKAIRVQDFERKYIYNDENN